jgi:hypothetical protein
MIEGRTSAWLLEGTCSSWHSCSSAYPLPPSRCLSGNPAMELSVESVWLPHLKQLDLDLAAAVSNSNIIQAMVG